MDLDYETIGLLHKFADAAREAGFGLAGLLSEAEEHSVWFADIYDYIDGRQGDFIDVWQLLKDGADDLEKAARANDAAKVRECVEKCHKWISSLSGALPELTDGLGRARVFYNEAIERQHRFKAAVERAGEALGQMKHGCETGLSIYNQLSLDGEKNMKTACLSNQLVRIARMLEAADDDWWSLLYPWEFDLLSRCMDQCTLFDEAPKFSNSISAVKNMKNIYRVPCTYSFSEEFDEDGSEINLLTLKVDIPIYNAIGLVTLASEDVALRASPELKKRIDTEENFDKRLEDKIGEVNRDNLIGLYDASMLELSEFRIKIESGVVDEVKGKFPHADVSVLEDVIYNAGESYKFKGMNRGGELVGEMKLTPNPITIEILGLKNRGELDSARSLINKLMRSLGVERA